MVITLTRDSIRSSMMGRRLCGEGEYPEPLLAVAGYGLPGACRTFPCEPLTEQGWAAVLVAAQTHRVTGLLSAATWDGALPATQGQVEQARSVHRATLLRVMMLERELVAVVELLASGGVESRILKGSAVAYLDYADPALRSFIDLDVLVRASDIDRAVAVLSTAGFQRTLAEPRPGFDRRFDKEMTLIPYAGFELDLHRPFVLGPWGLRDWPLRLSSLRDVAEMLRRVDRIAPAGEFSDWAERHVPGRREQAWLALRTHADETFSAQAIATLRVLLRRWRDKAAYLRTLILPDKRYTAGRHASPLARFGYAVRKIRRGRGAQR